MSLALRCISLLLIGTICLAGAVAFAGGPAFAEAPAPSAASFALIVGSNATGPGQQELRYAEHDAAQMTTVLRDVGGYPAANVVTALHPDRAGLRAAVASLRERLQQHTARGEQAELLFYYSGHACADSSTARSRRRRPGTNATTASS